MNDGVRVSFGLGSKDKDSLVFDVVASAPKVWGAFGVVVIPSMGISLVGVAGVSYDYGAV